jgi:hypothetical protein
MSKTKPKTTAIKKAVAPGFQPDVSNTLVGVTEPVLRAIALGCSTIMHAQPQFTNQTSPSNIVSMADLMFKYMIGAIVVKTPSEEVENAEQPEGATFG